MPALAAVLLFAVLSDPREAPVRPLDPPAGNGEGQLAPEAKEAPARPPADPRGAVEALLGARDGGVSAERWRRLGPRAAPILGQIASDEQALPTRRARALEGLVALHAPQAPDLVTRLLQSEAEAFVLRLAAVRAAARVLPAARQLPALRAALEKSSDAHLRSAAAEVLSRHPAGCAAVRDQARRESAETRKSFAPSLTRCGAK